MADEHYGSMVWTEQFALQGFRLSVPEGEAADAVAYLATVRSRKIRRPPDRPDEVIWRILAVILMIGYSPIVGWLPVAGLRRHGLNLWIVGLTVAVGCLAVTGFFCLLSIFLPEQRFEFVEFSTLQFGAIALIVFMNRPRITGPAPDTNAMDE